MTNKPENTFIDDDDIAILRYRFCAIAEVKNRVTAKPPTTMPVKKQTANDLWVRVGALVGVSPGEVGFLFEQAWKEPNEIVIAAFQEFLNSVNLTSELDGKLRAIRIAEEKNEEQYQRALDEYNRAKERAKRDVDLKLLDQAEAQDRFQQRWEKTMRSIDKCLRVNGNDIRKLARTDQVLVMALQRSGLVRIKDAKVQFSFDQVSNAGDNQKVKVIDIYEQMREKERAEDGSLSSVLRNELKGR